MHAIARISQSETPPNLSLTYFWMSNPSRYMTAGMKRKLTYVWHCDKFVEARYLDLCGLASNIVGWEPTNYMRYA